jgi:flagellar biosynthesis/type III secretory pathway protein FliH
MEPRSVVVKSDNGALKRQLAHRFTSLVAYRLT